MPQSWATAYYGRCRTRAGLGVDLDHGGVHGVAPGDRRRLPVISLLQPGIDPGGRPLSQPGSRGPGDAASETSAARDPDHADRRAAQFEIAARRIRGCWQAMEKALSRSRSLAWSIAAERVTVLRLAIVPKPMAMAAVSASGHDVFGSDQPGSAATWAKIVSIPCPCGHAPEET